MQLHVGSGIGAGPTTMAAFDSALNEVGIANYNLLRLSSVIPPDSKVTVHQGKIPFAMPGAWGDRMYVVMAEMRTDKHNVDAWAGVGWVQDKKTGRGMFTEHEGESEDYVRREITESLGAFIRTREKDGDFDWGPIQMEVVGRTCHDQPVCAMVAVVFQVSDWENEPHFVKNTSKLAFWKRSAVGLR